MSKKPWMPLYIGDFIADTMHLGATETGIYIRLIMHCWQHGTIPRDRRQLALIAHCDTRLWRQYEGTILHFFDVVDASTAHHPRVTSELHRYSEISNKRKGAAEQMHKNKDANDMQMLPQSQSHKKEKKETEPIGSGADAPSDPRKALFNEGLSKLAAITGKTPNSCRSLVGRWLSAVADEAVHILGWIEEAERNRVADPVGWISRQIQIFQGGRNGQTRRPQAAGNVIEAADRLLERVRQFDEPPPTRRVFNGEGTAVIRPIPKGGGG